MASKPGLFYAYAKHDGDDWSGRYLITFASRAVADEWWRAITDSIQRGYTRFSHIARHTMHFYSYNRMSAQIFDTLTDSEITGGSNLMNKVFFTLLDDRNGRSISPAPVLDCTDHRSGNEFFIRSMLQPEVFWFYDPRPGLIRPSKNRRSRFTITVVDPEQRLGSNPIMISMDRITIIVDANLVCSSFNGDQACLSMAHWDNKGIMTTASDFRFSDFDGGFQIKFSSHPDHDPEDFKNATIVPAVRKKGDRWELV